MATSGSGLIPGALFPREHGSRGHEAKLNLEVPFLFPGLGSGAHQNGGTSPLSRFAQPSQALPRSCYITLPDVAEHDLGEVGALVLGERMIGQIVQRLITGEQSDFNAAAVCQ